MVLAAQQWVNRTYSGRVGYVACPENGKTGWSTMYSLTRALQLELGITATSDSFGPTTLSKLQARGNVGPGDPKPNIVSIAQSAFYCKGYAPGGITGQFGPGTSFAVHSMMRDMGLQDYDNGTLQPKVYKALLTMDAYVVVSGGTADIRAIQQWLNGRYWLKSTFFVSPCDGLYTRDVQKALMRAIQYELGIPEASVNGNFGPSTQEGLKQKSVYPGHSGIFVQLFSAACVFNSPVTMGYNNTYTTTWRSTFDPTLQAFVRAFQEFSALPRAGRMMRDPDTGQAVYNGYGDYDTWAQLLVSMGNADRTEVYACDTRFHISVSRAVALKEAGYEVVGRYLDEPPDSSLNKEIQDGELEAIFAGGLRVFPIWQMHGRNLTDFLYGKGQEHGARAHERALQYGFNRGTVIYFAVDYDATDEQISSHIVPYFRGVQSGLAEKGRRYVAGVYGSRNVCTRVSNEAAARYSFVSGMSYAFSGNLGFSLPSNWSFNQIKEFKFTNGSDAFDLDRTVRRPNSDMGAGREDINGQASELDEFLQYIDDLYAAAVRYQAAYPNASSDTNLLVLDWLRSPNYTGIQKGWDILIQPASDHWRGWATDNAPQKRHSFTDPAYGFSVNIDHLAATARVILTQGTGAGTAADRGDFGGWGGDLTTLYAQWQNAEASYASGYAFCMERLARPTVDSSFSFPDMIEDVDGHLLGSQIRTGGKFNEELRRHLKGDGARTRFRQFWNDRFGGSRATCVGAARSMLTDGGIDVVLDGIRDGAVLYTAGPNTLVPQMLPAYKLDPYLEGFADTLIRLVDVESA
ncbi:glycoside hydrolase domain-containing protein [Geodermatophilus sp. DF01_2]|uniref:glycoside hydrolase domain-containing protein n=1 Tax=Geodermatophilus sp. DF01-2 TaxID=2559610 RepID=UPI001FD729A2|nr:glycoside hydrolase domain-containing protein [Geodermatophilus sp. DF01_2]